MPGVGGAMHNTRQGLRLLILRKPLIAPTERNTHAFGMNKPNWKRQPMLLISITVLATLLVVLLIANLGGGEKKVEQRIERLYALEDPRFLHKLGVLLGPRESAGEWGQVFQYSNATVQDLTPFFRERQGHVAGHDQRCAD
jgi:hypothetical protein